MTQERRDAVALLTLHQQDTALIDNVHVSLFAARHRVDLDPTPAVLRVKRCQHEGTRAAGVKPDVIEAFRRDLLEAMVELREGLMTLKNGLTALNAQVMEMCFRFKDVMRCDITLWAAQMPQGLTKDIFRTGGDAAGMHATEAVS